MKILYLSFESRIKDPIIDSQVVSLLEEILKIHEQDFKFTLLTFGEEYQLIEDSVDFIKHEIINKGFVRNTFKLVWYLLRYGNRFDIIHVRSYLPMLAVLLLKPFLKSKVIFDPRGAYPEEIFYLFKKKNLPYFFFEILEYFFCRYSDAIITVSSKLKKHYLSKYKLDTSKIFIIPTFCQEVTGITNTHKIIDLKEEYFKEKDITLFGFSGSYGNWQLTDEVFTFFRIVSELSDNSSFAIFSKDSLLFENEIKRLNLDRSRFFIKNLNKSELQNYMRQIDYGVLFRDASVVNRVAAPIKVKDYLKNGVKIIMTDNIGDDSELIKKMKIGHIVENLNHQDFVKIIDDIKNNTIEITREDIILLAEKEFSCNKIASSTSIIYYSLLKKYNG